MAKGRKTVSVDFMLEKANTVLSSNYLNKDAKKGICVMIESILMESNRYRGFSYNGGYRPNDPEFNEFARHYYS